MPLEDRDAAYLWDMLQAAREAEEMMQGYELAAFLEHRMLQRAVERCVELIGEAARRVCKHPAFPDSPIGTAFYSDLESIIAGYDIDLWIYGHTHSNLDVELYGTRIVANQPGYPGENVRGFNPGLLIEI